MPVPSPITSLNGLDRETLLVRETLLAWETLEGPSCAVSFTVLPELAGDWLDVQDRAAVRSAGACLAEIHRTLGATHVDGSVFSSRSTGLKERIGGWLENFDRGFAPEATRRLVGLLARASELDDQTQLVHNDFRAANILTRNSRTTGVLDFDDVVIDHRVSDLAKASVYLAPCSPIGDRHRSRYGRACAPATNPSVPSADPRQNGSRSSNCGTA